MSDGQPSTSVQQIVAGRFFRDELFANAFRYAAIGMALVAPDGRWLHVNRSLCDIIGYSEHELLATTFQQITHPDDLDTDLAYLHQLLAGTIPSYRLEKRYIHKQGHLVWILLSVSLVRDAADQPVYFISQIQDITDRKRAELALRRSEEHFSSVFELNPVGSSITTLAEGRVVNVNAKCLDMLGYTRDEVLGRSVEEIGVWTDRAERRKLVDVLLADGVYENWETSFRDKNGNQRYVLLTMKLLDVHGELCILSLMHDVTERRQYEQQILEQQQILTALNAELEALASTDGLTGIPNRRRFEQVLAHELQRVHRYGPPLSVLLLDVDQFKDYNDRFGHPAGDQVLIQIADILRATSRSIDTVARYGGEEFAVILPETDQAGAVCMAERMRQAIAGAPWQHRCVTASFGVATLALTPSPNSAALVAAADRALYAAKQGGRNRVIHAADLA